jgi:hypothetical protein
MKFEHFSDKHRNLNIQKDELLRKWKIQMLEEEQRLFEAAARKLQGVSTPPLCLLLGNQHQLLHNSWY